MKSLLAFVTALMMVFSFSVVIFAAEPEMSGSEHMMISGKMEIATGKVTSVDPQGMAITISEKIAGHETMDVGTIVSHDTIVKVNGKVATLDDIKVGDLVTIHYVKSDNLYAKEIDKA
jgi:Cu/Ag efflux protein CusF